METQFNFYPFNRTDKGLTVRGDNVILFIDNSYQKHYCGYTRLDISECPEEWNKSTWGDFPAGVDFLVVHGGVTYWHIEDNKHLVVGFDCAHSGDNVNEKLKDPDYIFTLTEQMRSQLIELCKRWPDFIAANRQERIAIIEQIRESAQLPCEYGLSALLSMMGGAEELGKEETR